MNSRWNSAGGVSPIHDTRLTACAACFFLDFLLRELHLQAKGISKAIA